MARTTNDYLGSIERFKYAIPNIQRASLFDVQIPDFKYGNRANGYSTDATGYILKFSVKNAPFPEATVGDISVNYMGRVVHFYGDRSYGGDWATTIILDGNWAIYDDIYAWNQAMNGANRIISEHINSHNNFKVDAYITAYTTNGDISRRALIHGLWPKSIAEISMDWTSTDSAVDLSVTWTYDYVTTEISASDEYEAGENSNPGKTNASLESLEGRNAQVGTGRNGH